MIILAGLTISIIFQNRKFLLLVAVSVETQIIRSFLASRLGRVAVEDDLDGVGDILALESHQILYQLSRHSNVWLLKRESISERVLY